jgi:CBS domain-containing protein
MNVMIVRTLDDYRATVDPLAAMLETVNPASNGGLHRRARRHSSKRDVHWCLHLPVADAESAPGTANAVPTVMPDRSIALSLRARDFMQTDLLTVTADTPLVDIHRLFVEEEIHGAPVVDDDGAVVGVVSTLDLLRVVRDEFEAGTATSYFRDHGSYTWMRSVSTDGELEGRFGSATAVDVMTRELVTVTLDTPVAEVAHTMRVQRVHRVLVVEDRELRGVITTFDLLRAFVPDTARVGDDKTPAKRA